MRPTATESSQPAASIALVAAALADLPLLASGKVREIYDLGDELLIVASDRISTYDVVHPDAAPAQGRRAHRPLDVLVRAHRRDPPQPPDLGDRRRPGGGPRPRHGRQEADDAPGRVCRARLHHRLGLEGLPGHRQGFRDRAARRPARVRTAAGAAVHPVDQGGGRSRRGDRLRRRRRADRRPGAGRARPRRLDRAVPATRPTTRARTGSSSPTRSSSSGSTPTAR